MGTYDIYYFMDNVYYLQKGYSSFKMAKKMYDEDLKGYIKCGDRILKRYRGK